MNLTPVNVAMLGIGILLIYCAWVDLKPPDVIKAALQGKTITPPPKVTTPPKDDQSVTHGPRPIVTSV
jgi:hypothetical protein